MMVYLCYTQLKEVLLRLFIIIVCVWIDMGATPPVRV